LIKLNYLKALIVNMSVLGNIFGKSRIMKLRRLTFCFLNIKLPTGDAPVLRTEDGSMYSSRINDVRMKQ
jgi:hypothetical protein